MLVSILCILIGGFFVGQVARRLGAPPLIGMIGVGLLLGPQGMHILSPTFLVAAAPLRTVAVMIILVKAGLGLDQEKLQQQGTVALRLGLFPAACEALVVAFAATRIVGFDLPTGLLLGCVLGAESPAVIVPGMLRLKSLGWGVGKGIPDAIITGSALSNILLLLVFSLLLNQLGPGGLSSLGWLPIQVLTQVGLGLAFGYGAARLLIVVLTQQQWTQNAVQDTLVSAGLALGLVVTAEVWPYFSGYLAAMGMGFFVVTQDAPLARRLRQGFESLWTIFEILLFVLLGASLPITILGGVVLPGTGLIVIGTLVGRSLGWLLSTAGSNWTWRERLFLLPSNSAKATVQAAIGGIPLTQGIPGGEVILAVAVLAILITAPLGAWAIPRFAPQLLTRDQVDPT